MLASQGYTPGLLLYRKIGEQFVIGSGDNEAIITVEEARAGRCAVRIIAGKGVRILRMELVEQEEFSKKKETDEFGKY